MDLGLDGLVALVAASSRGLGFAAGNELVKEGANVMICGRDAASVDEAVEKLAAVAMGATTPTVAGTTADVTSESDIVRLVAATVDRFGGLDILITNAGGPPGGEFTSLGESDWQMAFELTMMSTVRLIREALPHLRQSETPSILTITSISVKEPIAGLLLSNAIRPGVVGLTKTLSMELAGAGIRANSILPGWTRTERVDEIMAYRAKTNGTSVDEEVAKITTSIPAGRMGRPEEFGRVAAFLVSPAASYINGAMIQVDGGSYSGLL